MGSVVFRATALAVAFLVVCVAVPTQAAIQFGQVDTFQDGSVMGWGEGFSSENPPANVAGGPGGASDRYLRNVSSGGFGGGSRQVMLNQSQWVGNYNAAGVTRIDASLANFGAGPLHMRVALQSATGTWVASTRAAVVPADGQWRQFTFDLSGRSLSRVTGAEAVGSVLSNVFEVRLLAASARPDFRGDAIVATLGADNLRALRLPGDADFDGRVTAGELLLVQRHLGESGPGVGWDDGDFNFDGRVDRADVALARRHYGESIPVTAGGAFLSDGTVAAVPEPAAGLLFSLTALALLSRRPHGRLAKVLPRPGR